MILREGHEAENVGLSLVHEGGEFRHFRAQLIGQPLSGDVEKKGAVVRFRILSHSHALFGTLSVLTSVHGRRPTKRVTTLPHPGHSKVCISAPSLRCQSGSTLAIVIS